VYAGLDDVWDLELYGKLLETGGGKERMTAYFSVSPCPFALPVGLAICPADPIGLEWDSRPGMGYQAWNGISGLEWGV
jgi:hypothetical protein